MKTKLIIVFTSLLFSIFIRCNALEAELLSQLQFDQKDMVLMPVKNLLEQGITHSSIIEGLEHYHSTQTYSQSLEDYRSNPNRYFSQRLAALEGLIEVLSKTTTINPILENLKNQAENKILYIRTLPSMQNPHCTKPDALDLLPSKLLSIRDHYQLEVLDPLHRSSTEVQQYRWQGSSIPNFFIYLDTVENNELLNTYASPFQVKYFYNAETRNPHRLHFNDGFVYSDNGQLFDTSSYDAFHSGEGFAIFVIGEDMHFYANNHLKDHFHHSSEFAGMPVAGAGEISVAKGKIQSISNKSGHYHPSEKDMLETLAILKNNTGNLEGIEAHLYLKTPYAFLSVFYDAEEFLSSQGQCLPHPSTDYSILEIAVHQNLVELADYSLHLEQNTRNAKNAYPLHIAAYTNNSFWIDYLLRHSFSPFALDDKEQTPLEIAAECGYVEILEQLYEATCDEAIRYKAFFLAATSGNVNALQFFLTKDHFLSQKDLDGNTLFHFAAKAPSSDMLSFLLRNSIAEDVYLSNSNGSTPLHLACKYGSIDTVKLLMDLGLNISLQNNNGNTAFHMAMEQRSSINAAYLIDKVPSSLFFMKNDQGAIPLHIGAANLTLETFGLLYNHTKSKDILDYHGQSPLFYAIRGHSSQAKKNFCYLIENGADFHLKNNKGYSIVHQAVCDDYFALPLALTYVNGLHGKTPEGNTPLHIAFLKGCKRNIHYLLEYATKDSIMETNHEGKNILDLATQLGDTAILELVLEVFNKS